MTNELKPCHKGPFSRHEIGEVRNADGQTIASFYWNSSTKSPVTKDDARALAEEYVAFLNRPPPIAGVTPSVEECRGAFDEACERKLKDSRASRRSADYEGVSAVRDLCLAQAAERKGASREWWDSSVDLWYQLGDDGALSVKVGDRWFPAQGAHSAMIRRLLSLTTPNAPGREETA